MPTQGYQILLNMWSLSLSKKNNTNFPEEVERIFNEHISELQLIKAHLGTLGTIKGVNATPNWELKSLTLLIYGHFEGGVKNIADYTIDHVYKESPNTQMLRAPLFLKVNAGKISELGKMSSISEKLKLIEKINSNPKMLKVDCKKYIDTKSNLDSDNYEEICSLFDIVPYTDHLQASFISDFVGQTRHPIAHTGFLRSKKDVSFSDVVNQCNFVIDILTHFKDRTVASVNSKKYLHSTSLVFLNI